MKKVQTRKHFWLLSVTLMLLLSICVFRPVKAQAALQPTMLRIKLTDAAGSERTLKNMTDAEKKAVKITFTLVESHVKYTRTLKQLESKDWTICWPILFNKTHHAIITVDSSALKDYNYTLGGTIQESIGTATWKTNYAILTNRAVDIHKSHTYTFTLKQTIKSKVKTYQPAKIKFNKIADKGTNDVFYDARLSILVYGENGVTQKYSKALYALTRNAWEISVPFKSAQKQNVTIALECTGMKGYDYSLEGTGTASYGTAIAKSMVKLYPNNSITVQVLPGGNLTFDLQQKVTATTSNLHVITSYKINTSDKSAGLLQRLLEKANLKIFDASTNKLFKQISLGGTNIADGRSCKVDTVLNANTIYSISADPSVFKVILYGHEYSVKISLYDSKDSKKEMSNLKFRTSAGGENTYYATVTINEVDDGTGIVR